MRKQVLRISTAILFAFGSATFVACGESENHESEAHEQHEAEESEEQAHVHYQCPMDCEEGKVYEEEGSCPVCGMDLKEVES